MAKKSMIAREKKRQALVNKFSQKRKYLKQEFSQATSFEEKLAYHQKLQKLPRNSSPTRLGNRCAVTGRPKSVYRFFNLSRHVIREMAYAGLLPGVVKASW
jgi:small subunit ribosomal protein S14